MGGPVVPLVASWFLHFHSRPDRHKFLGTLPLTLGPSELSGDWGARGSHQNEEGAPRWEEGSFLWGGFGPSS